MLIDSRLSPQKIDMEFITWLGENGVPFGIIFTKVDKLSKAKVNENVEAVLNVLRESWEELPPYFLSSSENCTGKEEILNYIDQVNKSLL